MDPIVDDRTIDHVEREGWAVVPDVLTDSEVASARTALVAAAEASEARGIPTRMEILDPGGRNVRVYDLLEHDPIFVELVAHRAVWPAIDLLLDGDAMISNFTANIALPGSGSMNAHCDQSTVMPPPWDRRHTMNAIWCLDDIDAGNGATRFLPGSHHIVDWHEV
ncbi:MAG: phytanoyl-CoA dioxygenase family protein, partial [Acidimicrobiia bacterium]|nr:phytanoyl-CoA dioxygenase family protein [Acidimicrobiia bacterium]